MQNSKFLANAVILIVFLIHPVFAQSNVVVIPMAGDDVAMAQQNFRYDQRANTTSGPAAVMCTSDVFTTPDQETQVLLIGNANARFTFDSSYWFLKTQRRKDSGSWQDNSDSRAFTLARSDAWTQLSTTDILDLAPNSTYQFRLWLGIESGAEFSAVDNEYCELVVSATYKLPADKSILQIVGP